MGHPYSAALESMRSFWTDLSSALPTIAAAILLLIVGWIIARVVRRTLLRVLRFARFDILAEKAGIESFLLQGGVRYTAVTLIANLIYWTLMVAVIFAALNMLGLPNAASLFSKVLAYIPNVIVAVLVLMFGAFAAKLARAVTFTYLSNVGISGAVVIGHIAQWAILLFVLSIALEQLSLGGQVLVSAFQIAFGALCLALAIAFGLGGKEWAAGMLNKLLKP